MNFDIPKCLKISNLNMMMKIVFGLNSIKILSYHFKKKLFIDYSVQIIKDYTFLSGEEML